MTTLLGKNITLSLNSYSLAWFWIVTHIWIGIIGVMWLGIDWTCQWLLHVMKWSAYCIRVAVKKINFFIAMGLVINTQEPNNVTWIVLAPITDHSSNSKKVTRLRPNFHPRRCDIIHDFHSLSMSRTITVDNQLEWVNGSQLPSLVIHSLLVGFLVHNHSIKTFKCHIVKIEVLCRQGL